VARTVKSPKDADKFNSEDGLLLKERLGGRGAVRRERAGDIAQGKKKYGSRLIGIVGPAKGSNIRRTGKKDICLRRI